LLDMKQADDKQEARDVDQALSPDRTEAQCKAGDSMPAPDGCNTCRCDEQGSWACTEMACPDGGGEPGDSACTFITQETFPPRIHGECKYEAVSSERLTVELPQEAQAKTLRLGINDSVTAPVAAGREVKLEGKRLEIGVAELVGRGLMLYIDYVGDSSPSFDEQACATAKRSLQDVLDLVDGAPQACASDADCVAVGRASNACASIFSFTSRAAFAPYADRHAAAIKEVARTCSAASPVCTDVAYPDKAACDLKTHQCVGRF
jgi:hypothetical protein